MPVIAIEPRGAAFAQVLALSKTAKQTVGFLSDSAFRDRANQGTLLGVAEGNKVDAYVLFDLPRDEVKIVQLVVDEHQRNRGHARMLIDEIARLHSSRMGIFLNCRTDFPAHAAWPRLGFVPTGERVGRSYDGRPLTRWWKSFGHPNLFSLLEVNEARQTAVLDSSSFFDLVAVNAHPDIEQLRSDWIGDHVRLAITDEVWVEIANGKDAAERHRERDAARAFATLSPDEALWRPYFDQLRNAHPVAPASDEHDLRQIARALASQAAWLITGDPAMRHRYGKTAERLGSLRLASPDQFVREVDTLARGDWYRPVELERTVVTSREAVARDLAGLADLFVRHRTGETIRRLRAQITRFGSRPEEYHLQVVEVDASLRALICFRSRPQQLTAELLRVAAGKGDHVLGRYLLRRLRDEAAQRGLPRIVIGDQHLDPATRRGISVEGFEELSDGTHVALSIPGRGTLEDLAAEIAKVTSTDEERSRFDGLRDGDYRIAFRSEARFAPFRVIGAGIRTFLVPIQQHFASELFDSGLAAGQLFPRPWELGLRRELVYYRSPRNDGGMSAPARLLWYVSGKGNGAQHIRAVSLLNEVLIAPPDHLAHRFERLGVYGRREIEIAAGKDGRAMALRFSDTQLFEHPITLDEFRGIIREQGHQNIVLRSPRPITEALFERIFRQGTGAHE